MSITHHTEVEESRPESPEGLWSRVERVLGQVALPALRISLGLVFLWFGALKATGDSPVADIVHATLPWLDESVLMPVLGWFEIVLGVALLIGKPRRLALVVAAAHLAGTFLVFIQAPTLVMTDGNPLLLTTTGEFVLKNIVLIAAALVLLGLTDRRGKAA
ncbi:DoxX family protein [Actinokineospora iranica]|uniref:DoxX protein n=1 Tax=Actinokineospora iranica TaxID=1271860 RepID=A0A1G6JB49_9PSEU|nr:DoxX family protein [Actinokineospora iranica]SDC16122.1 DoxX protein [Actinokineospora iranica]